MTHKRNTLPLLILAATIAFGVTIAHAQRPLTFEDVIATGRVAEAQIAPDGKHIVYTVQQFDLKTNGSTQALWLADVESGENRRLTVPPEGKRDRTPVWSPDGASLAFVSNRSGSYQIWTISLQGGDPRKLTDFPVDVTPAGLLWSPDGARFAFLAAVFPDCEGDVLACTAMRLKEKEDSGVEARTYDKLFFRHWVEWEDGTRAHLFVMPAAGGDAADLTPGDSNVPAYLEGGTGYDFSPDGTEIAYARNVDTAKFADEALSTNSDVWVVPVSGGEATRVTKSPGWDGTPQYSPNGKWIAYVAMDRAGYESDHRHLMLIDRATGKTEDLTGGFPHNVGGFMWEPDSGGLIFTASVDARVPIYRVSLPSKEVTPVVEGVYAGSLSLSSDGEVIAYISQSSTKPSEVFAYRPGTTMGGQVSRVNDAHFADIEMNPAEPIYVKGAGGAEVHAWLIKPPGFDPANKYPVVVLIHGGPQGTWGDSFHPRWNMQLFAAPGYVVVAPNPRGSPGWGKKFVEEISRDWGGKVFTDIMNVVDHVAGLPYTDKKRMCAGGGSYGGYMTDWILGHTDRFQCLFSHAGVYNIESMYGSTEELWFVEWDLGGPPWSHPEDYEKWSPHKFVEKFKTPTLVIQGGRDYRVPLEQSLQLFTGLQRRGVESRFLYFPDEGHWILKPKNSQFWYKTVHEWLAQHLK